MKIYLHWSLSFQEHSPWGNPKTKSAKTEAAVIIHEGAQLRVKEIRLDWEVNTDLKNNNNKTLHRNGVNQQNFKLSILVLSSISLRMNAPSYCCPKNIDHFILSFVQKCIKFLSFSFSNVRICCFCSYCSELDIFRPVGEVLSVFTILPATALYAALISNLRVNKCVGEKPHSDSYYPSVWRDKLKRLMPSYTTFHFKL